ncbi:MAG TPA: HAMP domain-containing sensor histidine kinase [Streptosporangiaceae bacterium]|nr:HAMP domain-containing sensor histidine kinase [Streptosporangiaceae bacterium]
MSGRSRPAENRRRARWLGQGLFGVDAGRTLSARLITGVLLLLVGACAIIGVVTYLVIRGSMVSALDGQLRSSSGTYAGCIENTHQDGTGQAGNSNPPDDHSDYGQPPPNNINCSLGQPQGMLGMRTKYGQITNCGIVNGMTNQECPRFSAADKKALAALPVYLPPRGQPPWSNAAYTVKLASLGADYRMTAVAGHDNDILITGLPLSSVESTLNQIAAAELIVFLCVLVLAGVLGTALVRLSLRPLRRVAATAARVAELPLDSGEVSLPTGVPDNDPRTEVGRVGAAFNRMLYHVEKALGRREASEARLRRFAADASHELRTPLSAIRGYAELALRNQGPVPEDVTHALRRIQSESSRMGVLVDDLLLLARLDAGRPLEREPVDLSRLVVETTSDARVARGDHRWRLDLPDEPVLVEGDEHRLHQVLANLLSNAGKHTPPGSTVSVALALADAAPGDASPGGPSRAEPGVPEVRRGVAPPGPRVELSITDDGPGIPPELLPELFERFTRGDTGRARDASAAGRSTGLGLAIVDAVVAAHGGGISVTSRPGLTRFAILLPLLPEPADQPEASPV